MASTSAMNSSGDRDETRQKIKDNKDKIEELRRKFFEENSTDDPDSPFDPRDLEWIRTSEAYMYNVLLIGKMDVDTASEKLNKILKWRKEYGVNDLTFDSFPEEMQQKGALYPHTVDKNGHRILWYHVKHYRKDPETQMWAKKMTVYWLNKLQKEDPEHRIVILEDMTGAGVSNMDVDLVRFKIQCFELYFPALVEILYIYDMAWILNTLWKVIEKLLSQQARDHIKFIRGKEVQQYVDLDSLPTHMGGTDTYEWTYTPGDEDAEMKDVEDDEAAADGDVSFRSMDGDNDRTLLTLVNAATSLRQHKQHKKVHFQDEVDGKENVDPEHTSHHRKHRKHASHSKKGKSRETYFGPLVSIRPGELLVFEPPSSISGSEGISASLTISNTTENKVVYKVKTTTPDRYKVRPSMGPINPGSAIHITITLLSGPGESVVRDKFLILSSRPPDDAAFKTTSEITAFWKNVGPEDKVEHRMSCLFNPLKSAKGDAPDQTEKHMKSILNKLNTMDIQIEELRKQNSRLVWLQGFVFLASIFILVYLYLYTPAEGVLLAHSGRSQQAGCLPSAEVTEKFLRGAREGL